MIRILFVILSFLCSGNVNADQGLPVPIFQHNYQSQVHKMLEVVGLESVNDTFFQKKEADEKFSELESSVNLLLEGRSTILGDLDEAYSSAASLVFYYTNHADGIGDIRKLVKARRWLTDLTAYYLSKSEQVDQKDRDEDFVSKTLRARYVHFISLLHSRRKDMSTLTKAMKFRNSLAPLSEYKGSFDLVLGGWLIQFAKTSQQGSAILQSVRPKTVHQSLTLEICKALYLSGIDGDGLVYQSPDKEVFFRLDRSLKPSPRVSFKFKEFIIDTLFFVWQKGYQKTFSTPPFDYSEYADQVPVGAYLESLAFDQIKKGKPLQAVRYYEKLLAIHSGNPVSGMVLQRSWNLYKQSYNSSMKPLILKNGFAHLLRILQTSLSAQTEASEESLGQIENLKQSYLSKLFALVSGLKSKKENNKPSLNLPSFQDTMDVAEAALKSISDQKLTRPLKVLMASTYAQYDLHENSVLHYLELSQAQPAKMLPLAINGQIKLASWSLQPNWKAPSPEGNVSERLKLISIYSRYLRYFPKSWSAVAQKGLLYRAVGKEQSAINLWHDALLAGATGPQAQEFAGQVIVSYRKESKWLEIVAIAPILKKFSEPITYAQNTINWQSFHAEALFNYAKASMNPGRYGRASRFFAEFIETYPRDSRLPAAYHMMGLAKIEQKNIADGLKDLQLLVSRFKKYPSRQEISKISGRVAFTAGNLDQFAEFFLRLYITEYTNTPDISQHRDMLGRLYVRQNQYQNAIKVFFAQLSDKNAGNRYKIGAAVNMIDLGIDYQQMAAAITGASALSKLIGASHPLMVKVYGAYAYQASQLGDFAEMNELERKLLSFAQNSSDARDSIGFIRFSRAEFMKTKMNNEIDLQYAKANGKEYITGILNYFDKQKGPYLKVCELGDNKWCAPALMRCYDMVSVIMDSVTDKEPEKALDESQQREFIAIKEKALDDLQREGQTYSDEVRRLAAQKNIPKYWRDRIVQRLGH